MLNSNLGKYRYFPWIKRHADNKIDENGDYIIMWGNT